MICDTSCVRWASAKASAISSSSTTEAPSVSSQPGWRHRAGIDDPDVLSATLSTTLRQAANIMRGRPIGCVLVVETAGTAPSSLPIAFTSQDQWQSVADLTSQRCCASVSRLTQADGVAHGRLRIDWGLRDSGPRWTRRFDRLAWFSTIRLAACFAALLGTRDHGRWLLAPAADVQRIERAAKIRREY